ncbi:DNA primase [Ideonella sp. A 288]|uniref:DNA primase n=1 Tax=Ideonella sp. A 288 TaxID=1962181 RepID=UPI000B4B0E1A|nr:DNA primase [Ideonella sp. A 288]
MLPQGFIQDLLSRVDVVEVVGRHVELRKAGINHKGLCPFHGEKSPSFIVSPSRQTYHCFGCGAHGDAIRFLTEQGGLGFMDAVRELAQQAGLVVPETRTTPEEQAREAKQREQKASLGSVLERAEAHYKQALKASPRAIDYLKSRGLTGAIAARFGLGYAPEGWRTLAGVFPSYDDPLLVESGLVIVQGEDEADQKRYDRFRDRIMFPIRSVRGEVIGFGGRVLDRGEPKYLNSPETPLFHKGQELYGLYEARQALRARGHVLVVEGYMDVVALAQSGFGNAVATLGTACTAEHVAKLFRFTDSVVFSFDGDAAGRRAAGRALEASLPHATDTRTIRFLFLPPEHDPDSYVRELGADAFEQAVTQAVPLSVQLATQAGEGCDLATAEGRSRLISQARPLVELLPEGLLRGQVEADLAQRAGLTLEALQQHWGRRQRERSSKPATGAVRMRAMGGGRAPPHTATLLDRACWLVAGHTDLWHDMPQATHEMLISQPAPYGPFFSAIERLLHEHGTMAMAAVLDELARDAEADTLAPLLARLQQFHEALDGVPAEDMAALVHQLKLRAVADELNWLLESGDLSEVERGRFNTLTQLRNRLKTQPPAPLQEG